MVIAAAKVNSTINVYPGYEYRTARDMSVRHAMARRDPDCDRANADSPARLFLRGSRQSSGAKNSSSEISEHFRTDSDRTYSFALQFRSDPNRIFKASFRH